MARKSGLVAIVLLALFASRASAQSLAGRVLARGLEPVAEALVTLSAATGQAVSARSAADGRFVLRLPAGAGPWQLSVQRLGFVTARIALERPTAGTITRDVLLTAQPTLLTGIQARASRTPLAESPGGAGATAEGIKATYFDWVAVDPGDLGAAASTRDGVIPLGTTAAGTSVSILGQAPSATQTTLDGANFGAGGLPQEAMRKLGVVVTVYDVSRGQFTGGQLTATTHTGSNDAGASFSVRMRGQPLSWAGARTPPLAERAWVQGSGGAGGALVRDRLFVFGAAQWSHRSAQSALGSSADVLARGVPADSLARALDVLRANGLPASLSARAPASNAGSAILRLDGVLSRAHQVGLRFDGRLSREVDQPVLSLDGSGITHNGRGGGVMASLVSRVGDASNELHVYRSEGTQRNEPDATGPAGRVLVGGEGAGEALQFGAATMRSRAARSLLDVGDAFNLRLAGNTHRLQAGFAYVAERARVTELGNANGTFVFNSIQDLAAGRPSEFTRSLATEPGAAETRYGAVYGGHALQLHHLALSYGLRADALWYGSEFGSPAVDSTLGVTPGRVPSRTTISPRLAFDYEFRNHRGSTVGTVRGGVGRFVGRPAADGLAWAMGETGGTQRDLVCVGPAAPTPDWGAYASSPGSIPTTCRDGSGAFASLAPRVSIFSPSYTAPRAWHASLYANWQPAAKFSVNAEGVVVRGDGNPVAFDRNLSGAPAFTLVTEGERAVYAPSTAIDPATGGVAFSASRLDSGFGTVREIGGGRSLTRQLMLGAFTFVERATMITASYTYTDSRDHVGALDAPGGSQPLARGDAVALIGATADFERRHFGQVTVTRPFGNHVRMSLLARAGSGLPYTPRVQGDVNGDGSWNDAAFVFDPASANAPAGYGDALAQLPRTARACLARQRGRIAARNSCRGPWTGTVDAQAEIIPSPRPFVAPRLRFTVLASNLLGVADYLFNGNDGLRGWGQLSIPDPTLLRVSGFDPARRAFVYDVNRAFGHSLSSRFGNRPAFTITLQARLAVGDDPARHWLTESRRAESSYARPPGELARLISERVTDLPLLVLEHDDSLRLSLSAGQRREIGDLAEALHARLLPMIDALARVASAADTVATPSAPIRAELRAQTAEVQGVLAETAGQVRAILTPEQWARLPGPWRDPPAGRPLVPFKMITVASEEP